jgi:hypothetical protein
MSLGLQWALVVLALAASCAYLVRRQWPKTIDGAQRRLAIWLLRPARPAALRQLGRRIAPAPSVAIPSGGACGGCTDRKACGSHSA